MHLDQCHNLVETPQKMQTIFSLQVSSSSSSSPSVCMTEGCVGKQPNSHLCCNEELDGFDDQDTNLLPCELKTQENISIEAGNTYVDDGYWSMVN